MHLKKLLFQQMYTSSLSQITPCTRPLRHTITNTLEAEIMYRTSVGVMHAAAHGATAAWYAEVAMPTQNSRVAWRRAMRIMKVVRVLTLQARVYPFTEAHIF